MTRIRLRAPSCALSSLFAISLLAGCGAAPTDSEAIGVSTEKINTAKFSGWSPLPGGGALTSGPAVVTRSTGSIDVWARATDNTIYSQFGFISGGSWSWLGWQPLGAPNVNGADGRPSATRTQIGGTVGLAVAARARVGTDHRIFARTWLSGSGYTPWAQVTSGGNLENDPALVFSNQSLFVFAPGTNHQVYWSTNDIHLGYNSANWSAWSVIPGGDLRSDLTAAVNGNDIYVAGLGTNNKIWYTKSNNSGSTWAGWNEIPSSITFAGAPSLVTAPGLTSRLHVFATRNDASKEMWSSTGTISSGVLSWQAFQASGGALNDGPGSASPADGTIEVFGLATDQNVYRNPYQE